ncbi:hypothetical protein P3S68_011282 [Capsicum galapagoense]
MKRSVDESNSELRAILELLMDPTWLATGLKVDFDTLVNDCGEISCRISEIISVHGESDQKISSLPAISGQLHQKRYDIKYSKIAGKKQVQRGKAVIECRGAYGV